MTVELISVGTEILLGNIVNTNAAYLAEKIALLGLSCYHQSAVGDNEERLEDAIRLALSRSDIVILSGGLGPTKDDLTKEVTAKVFGRELYEDAHSKERIQAYFDRRRAQGREITANNWKQALVPEGSLRQIASFVGGLLLLAALLRPLLSAVPVQLELDLNAYRSQIQQREAEFAQEEAADGRR